MHEEEEGKNLSSAVFIRAVKLNVDTWKVVSTDTGTLGWEDTSIQSFCVCVCGYMCVSDCLMLLQPHNYGCATQCCCLNIIQTYGNRMQATVLSQMGRTLILTLKTASGNWRGGGIKKTTKILPFIFKGKR